MKKNTWMFVWIAIIAVVACLAVYGSMDAIRNDVPGTNLMDSRLSPSIGATSTSSPIMKAEGGTCTAGPASCSCTGTTCESETDVNGRSISVCFNPDKDNVGKCTETRCTHRVNKDGTSSCSCSTTSNKHCPSNPQ
jgi:hypothetical protein